MKKQYKLIKLYPGVELPLGTITTLLEKTGWYTCKNSSGFRVNIKKMFIENYPEFWQEVVEPVAKAVEPIRKSVEPITKVVEPIKNYKLIKPWPAMPKIEIGTVINGNAVFFDSLPAYFMEVTQPIKSYKLIKHWPLATDIQIGTVIKYNEKTGKYYSPKYPTPFGMFSLYKLEEKVIKDNLEYWKAVEEATQTPFEKRGLMPNKENAFKILRSLTATEEKDKKWIEDWLKQNVQEFARLYRNSDTITRIIHAFIGIQSVVKSKHQEDLIKECKAATPEKTVVSIPAGLGKAGFSEKTPVGIIPKEIHNENRLNDINQAIDRYIQVKKDIPAEWLIEKRELETRLT